MSLKVLMFGWELAPIVHGGLGVVCRSIADRLVKKGVKLTYVMPKIPINISVENFDLLNASSYGIDESLINIISVNSLLTPYLSAGKYTSIYNSFTKNGQTYESTDVYGHDLFTEVERFALRTSQIISDKDFDIIHAHDWMTFKAAVIAKKFLNKPLIVHIHATEFDRSAGNPNPSVLDYEKYGLENADKIIAVSNYTKNKIIELYNIDSSKIQVVHNAIEKQTLKTDTLLPSQNESQVLFLGRLTIAKGADYLLRAAQKVVQVYPKVKFIFVGKGEMIEDLVEQSINLGISKNVIFTGWLNHDQVDLAYKNSDLFVMPSITEPFGLTALEAMRNGTPVLMSKQSGVSEVVQNCLKVDFWDTEEMANKILSVLRYKALKDTLMENGKLEINNFDWDHQTDKIINLYNQILVHA